MAHIGQLARLETDISESAVWQRTSGDSNAAMIDETIRDRTVSETISPNNSPNTHTFECKFGANWNGSALARPQDNTSVHIQIDYKVVVSALDFVVKLYEGATLRETKNFGSLASTAGVYTTLYWNVASATVDAITDFTDLRLRFEATQNAVNERLGISYVHMSMGATDGPGHCEYTEDFSLLSEMPRCWVQESTGGTPDAPVTVSGGILTAPSATFQITCHAVDLPADCYARIRYATGHDNSQIGMAAYVRLAEDGVAPGTDTPRYNAVSNRLVGPQWEIELDGISDEVFDTLLYTAAGTPNAGPVAGDMLETRAIGGLIQGLKNGRVILSAGEDEISRFTYVTAPGWSGVACQYGGPSNVTIDYFKTGSISTKIAPAYTAFPKHIIAERAQGVS